MNLFDAFLIGAAAVCLGAGTLLRLTAPPGWVKSAGARVRRHRDLYLAVLALTAAVTFGTLAYIANTTTNPLWWFTPSLIAVAGIALAAKLQQGGTR